MSLFKRRSPEDSSDRVQQPNEKRGVVRRLAPAFVVLAAFGAGFLVNETTQSNEPASTQIEAGIDTVADECFDAIEFKLDRSKPLDAIEADLNKQYQACITEGTKDSVAAGVKAAGTLAINEQFQLVQVQG